MFLDQYEPLSFNANFKEAADGGRMAAYRGDLILQEGEVADSQGAPQATNRRTQAGDSAGRW